MKKYLFILLFLLAFSQLLRSQESISLYRDDIVGRWIEQKRIEGDKEIVAGEYPDTYIFRDTGVFHKGEASEGVILFNITGRYKIENDIISIIYADYLQDMDKRKEPKLLSFKVLSISDEGMLVSVTDYEKKYRMILKR
ncbi:hypothetical protein JGH11_13700 [Dysgonomonas sp. Marseille-P4677]|uniref:hypothetical protein n=1 Tax=Dysgonomonas sp. Marseille-P4677 TaxID=2364790 RepID=UPI0019130891|nr:hypothetical protein [Dysgonomonas sp. Marseille-P4677]MBK5721929.1 hypothetical protein [Dysgonomonas sp. Marseille-P4677]